MDNRYIWSCSSPLIIKEIQIKTTMRHHLKAVRMGITKNIDNKCWQGYGEKGILVHSWWECKLMQPLWKTIWSFLKKLKRELPYDSAILLLGIYAEELKLGFLRDIWPPMFIAGLFTMTKIWKQTKCPSVNEWMRKIWYTHTMEYYSAFKMKEILSFVIWMNLEIIVLSEISQIQETNTTWY